MRDEAIYVKLKKIYNDKTSGASILAGRLFSVLKEKARRSRNRNEFLRFLKDLKGDLKKYHPLLFQLQNLIDIVQSTLTRRVDIGETIVMIEKRFRMSNEKVASNFLEWLEARGLNKVSVATLSYSGTVFNAFLYAKDKISSVYIFRSCPKCEGDKMARKLQNKGFDVFLANDFALDYVLEKVEVVVSGCDAVFKNGNILNKAGTSAVFKIAKLAGKETLVLCDFSKFVRLKPTRNFKQLFMMGKSGNVKTIDVVFEIVDSNLITGYITDVGIIVNRDRERSEVVYNLSKMFGLWKDF